MAVDGGRHGLENVVVVVAVAEVHVGHQVVEHLFLVVVVVVLVAAIVAIVRIVGSVVVVLLLLVTVVVHHRLSMRARCDARMQAPIAEATAVHVVAVALHARLVA